MLIFIIITNCSIFNMAKFKRFIDQAFKESNKNYEILVSTNFRCNGQLESLMQSLLPFQVSKIKEQIFFRVFN